MLLGVLLALAAGTIVIYVVSQATGTGSHTVTVVVAAQDLTPGQVLSADASDSAHVAISTAFVTKQVNADFVPAGAYTYTDPTQLNADLIDKVVVAQFFIGDILHANDPRLAKLGTVGTGSLTLRNPGAIPSGDVLYPLKVGDAGSLGLVAQDHIDILVTYCVVNGTAGGAQACPSTNDETQTTLQNVYVYAVTSSQVFVVLSREDALTLKLIGDNGGNVSVVIRAPGDSSTANTFPATGSYIYSHFHFTQP
jgi:hypothetical protein